MMAPKSASLVNEDIDCVAMALALLPPLLSAQQVPCNLTPTEITTPYFCAASLPLPYLIPVTKKVILQHVDLTVRQILGLPVVTEAEVETRIPRKNHDADIIDKSNATIGRTSTTTSGDVCSSVHCSNPPNHTNHTLASTRANDCINFSLYASGDDLGGERVLTVNSVFSSQNGKLVLLGRISLPRYPNYTNDIVQAPYPPISINENQILGKRGMLVVAKLRMSTDGAEPLREHANELKILRLVTESKTRGMFPTLVGCGEVRILDSGRTATIPLLLMSYLPYPTITDLLRDSQLLPENPYSTGDKRIFHHDLVLRDGLDRAITALQFLGLKHGDLKSGNVVYRVGTGQFGGFGGAQERDGGVRGKVWLIDLESVGAITLEATEINGGYLKGEGNEDRRAVKDIICDFWKYELCCAEG